jgi:Integrase core domain
VDSRYAMDRAERCPRVWRTRSRLELAVVEYVAWFNHDRLHSAINYVPPADREALMISDERVTSPVDGTDERSAINAIVAVNVPHVARLATSRRTSRWSPGSSGFRDPRRGPRPAAREAAATAVRGNSRGSTAASRWGTCDLATPVRAVARSQVDAVQGGGDSLDQEGGCLRAGSRAAPAPRNARHQRAEQGASVETLP